MKKLSFIFLATLLAACAPQTRITAVWKKANDAKKIYTNVLVMSLNAEMPVRSQIEDDVAYELRRAGVSCSKSYEEFPPVFAKDSITRKDLYKKIAEKNIDAILTVSAIKKETDSRYVPGRCDYNPSVYYFNGRFWGYYHYWHPCVYQQGYYINSDKYFIETNFYDASTEVLVWSAQSVTYNPTELRSFSSSYSKLVVSKLLNDSVVKPIIKVAVK